ncbi:MULTISPECIES: hypothetical protein [Aeromonas]|uniref:hypothetical protein n=1 Tax=Aeromonas TaxID=642 RepID=UPI001CC80C74|nr:MULTISPECIES: hypothetical protein [Aeromonas]MCY9824331.1 hypothetical protein [Aeromonas media]MDX7718371.1 hypothetical protein [Aeromonas caviae]GJA39112.1 hypothetical protein KAM342_43550 [Aeromonas caviae]GJA79359.1 hypothetical protein KAM354_45950 [Aeromonas caviae]GJA96507.1 hypothetical protein KAM358_43390 [Aeromonas caviae]
MDCLYQLAVVLQGLAPRHTQASKIFLAAVQQDAPLLMGETAALVIQLGELLEQKLATAKTNVAGEIAMSFKLVFSKMRCPDKIGQSRIKQPEQFSNTSC